MSARSPRFGGAKPGGTAWRSPAMLVLLAASACSPERPAAPGSAGATGEPVAREPASRAAAGEPAAPVQPPPTRGLAAPPQPAVPAAAVSAPSVGVIPEATKQLLLAVVDDWSATTAELSRWERDDAAAPWRPVGAPWPAVTGSGLAWGRGLHGDGPPAGRSGERKREGDGKSPAGAFALHGAYGYGPRPPDGSRWPYTRVDARWYCVDDAASQAYGTILDSKDVAKDWASAEKMRRRDALYTWVVDVAHNPTHEANAGSCIFLHVWRTATSPTVGCTAMAQPELETLLRWMAPDAHPIYVLLPRAELDALAPSWGLPAR